MIPYIGDFVVNSTVRYFFGTNASAGASVNRTTAGSIRIYKNTSVTERTSTAGITDTSGFDSITGLNAVSIDLSNNTDAGFYAAGNDYVVVLFGAVVDSQTVNVPLFQFSVENRTSVTRSLSTGAITSASIANSAITLRLGSDPIASNARYVTYDSFSGHPLLSTTNQHQVAVTGSNHAAADIHQFQPNVLTATATDTTFVSEIQSGLSAPTAIQVADAVLNRNLDSSGDGTDTLNERTVRSALRAMRNKVSVASGVMTVTKEDDTATAWTASLSNTANVTVDPT